MRTPLLLLCLLWSLVEVHSQTAPYVTFMGETLPNHAYVDLSLVGNSANEEPFNTLLCHTDLATCCTYDQGIHRGDWRPPNSELRLPLRSEILNDDVIIYQGYGSQFVDLRRRNNANMTTGIYHCDIPTVAVHNDTDISIRDSVYVGLYLSSGGTI